MTYVFARGWTTLSRANSSLLIVSPLFSPLANADESSKYLKVSIVNRAEAAQRLDFQLHIPRSTPGTHVSIDIFEDSLLML